MVPGGHGCGDFGSPGGLRRQPEAWNPAGHADSDEARALMSSDESTIISRERFLMENPSVDMSVRKAIKIDLHIHSRYSSDGCLEPVEIVKIARKKRLGGIAVTDHNTIRGGVEAKKYETEDFKVIVGSEIMTDQGEITGLFLTDEIKTGTVSEVIAEIRKQGGMVCVPHPFDKLRHSAFRITPAYVDLVDAIECMNSRCVFPRFNREALEFATRHHLARVGGSDAHYASEIGLGGIITHSDDIREAIMHGEVELFGKRSPLMSHVRTKIGKYRRKLSSRIVRP